MATLREQFLERLIREFFLKKGSGFVLKGGAAIRALFGEERLTKDIDLDFTNPKRTAESLHNTVNRAITGAVRGLPMQDLQISAPSKGELSPRWKINFRDAEDQRYHVEIEVSRDPERAAPGQVIQKRFSPGAAAGIGRFWVDMYDEPTLIATKLAALLGREAPRDVYDLDRLMTAPPPSTPQVRWAIDRAGLDWQDPVTALRAHLDALSWERFMTDLRDSLPEEVAERIDETEWRAMKERVAAYAESLLSSNTGAGR
jgi:hypothetical protein